MIVSVVDTNVAIAANGRGTHADPSCRLACIERLEQLVGRGKVAIDDAGLILDEYKDRLCFSGEPGTGDAFFKYVFDTQYQGRRVRRVTVTPSDDDRKGFEGLLDALDPEVAAMQDRTGARMRPPAVRGRIGGRRSE